MQTSHSKKAPAAHGRTADADHDNFHNTDQATAARQADQRRGAGGLPALAVMSAALLLLACGKDDNRSAGQQVDAAIAQAGKTTENAAASAKKDLEQARDSTKAAADRASAAITKATDGASSKLETAASAVGGKLDDARITLSVNAALAKDPALSALRIKVDTSAGRVVLRGSAPDKAALDRAGQLAAAVRGVSSVDNQLEVRG